MYKRITKARFSYEQGDHSRSFIRTVPIYAYGPSYYEQCPLSLSKLFCLNAKSYGHRIYKG